jgi:hypothetical protein
MPTDISKLRNPQRFPADQSRQAHAALDVIETRCNAANLAAALRYMSEKRISKIVYELEGGGDEERVFFREAKDSDDKVIDGLVPDFPTVSSHLGWDGEEIVIGETDSGWGPTTELGNVVREKIETGRGGGWGANEGSSGFAVLDAKGHITYDLSPNPDEENEYDI